MLKIFSGLMFAIPLAFLLVVFFYPFEESREEACQLQCELNLERIAKALRDYASATGEFPPAYTVDETGRPLHSWRTLILPYLDEESIYNQIDLSKPWDDPANGHLSQINIAAYVCPEVRPAHQTTYMAVVTPKSFLHATAPAQLSELKDDKKNTMILVEIPPGEAVHWMDPTDADESLVLQAIASKKSNHHRGMHVAYLDGSVQHIPPNTASETVRAQITAAGGEPLKKPWTFRIFR